MHRTVLIVEDDKSIRESMSEALEMFGYPTAVASNGQEALDYLAQHENPGLIFLDLMMPVMNGWEFHAVLKTLPKHARVPVIVISAGGSTDKRAKEIGADEGLQKPIDLDDLKTAVDRYFDCAAMPA